MRRRFILSAAVALTIAAAGSPFAGAQVATQDVPVSATVLDGTRTMLAAAIPDLSGPRTGMTSNVLVTVTEVARTGTTPIRVRVSGSAMSCAGGTSAPASSLSVGSASGSVGYVVGQASPGAWAGGAGGTLDSARDLMVVTGELSTVSYSTLAGHTASTQVTFVPPATVPAGACTGTLTFDMLYA